MVLKTRMVKVSKMDSIPGFYKSNHRFLLERLRVRFLVELNGLIRSLKLCSRKKESIKGINCSKKFHEA